MIYEDSQQFTIAPQCPWYEAQQNFGPPNVNWCEPTICAYINEPANTWSNLSYMIAGVLIVKKINSIKEKLLRDFGWVIFWMGLCSFIYHATNNYFTQFLDFLGMFLLSSFMLSTQYLRIKKQNPRDYKTGFWFLMFIQTVIFWVLTLTKWLPIQLMVAAAVVPMLIGEIWARKIEGKLSNTKFLWVSAFFMLVAQIFSLLDHKRIWCEPENVFLHGHALWHMFGGVGMLFLGLHLKEVYKDIFQKS